MNLDLLTSEMPRPGGHPDKLADQISDAALDAHLAQDPMARVGVEAMLKGDQCWLAGEITSKAEVDLQAAVDSVVPGLRLTTAITRQDPQIARAVDNNGGAGDSGLIFGFAAVQTLPIQQCRTLVSLLENVSGLGADGKVQLTGTDGPIVIAVQHDPGFDIDTLRPLLPVDRELHLRGFVSGGIAEDAGLTGRKIVSDTYGGAAPNGGGCFSGKDPTKVDRSGAYAARYVALCVLRVTGAGEVLVQAAYAIGEAEPVALSILADGRPVDFYFDWRPEAIIERFGLRKPIYLDLARNGHFFRDHLPWEQTR